ncbi:uncharacterized protein LOC127277507 isoform X2 [Leptopilina boulardi]|uniref:uncharacterized protein LOC127277507 isoform X2 n=1 Tax=Leptopilina boulardi TaxID=63433 RepID=UPI0021F5A2CB|nr:uncharacterized protein LOC127277507 isoform X2 [Leptopilina boulardi]
MSGRGFCIKVEIDLHAITCPGVWLCPNGKVALRINTLKSSIESHRISPIFPLLFHDKFTFKMVFRGVTSLAALQCSLEDEFFYAELLQWTENSTGFVILSTFETNLADLLYPSSCFKGLLAGVDVDLLMEPTKFFPGILAPKIEVSTKTMVEEIVGICDSNATGAFVMNPKVIHSKNASNINRKQPTKGIIRQRKVCHSKGKAKYQPCHSCKKVTRLKVARSCSPVSSDRNTESPFECYHKQSKISNSSCAKSQKNCLNRENHKFENCPVCSKYNCYFSENSYEKEDFCCNKCENKKIINSPVKTHEAINSQLEKENNYEFRPKSVPSLKDPGNSILRDRIHHLQKAKEKFSNDTCIADSACVCDPSYDYCDHNRPAFYKNLEKFYKRMYKQAKLRAEQMDCY